MLLYEEFFIDVAPLDVFFAIGVCPRFRYLFPSPERQL
jgi:hypothetical protein